MTPAQYYTRIKRFRITNETGYTPLFLCLCFCTAWHLLSTTHAQEVVRGNTLKRVDEFRLGFHIRSCVSGDNIKWFIDLFCFMNVGSDTIRMSFRGQDGQIVFLLVYKYHLDCHIRVCVSEDMTDLLTYIFVNARSDTIRSFRGRDWLSVIPFVLECYLDCTLIFAFPRTKLTDWLIDLAVHECRIGHHYDSRGKEIDWFFCVHKYQSGYYHDLVLGERDWLIDCLISLFMTAGSVISRSCV